MYGEDRAGHMPAGTRACLSQLLSSAFLPSLPGDAVSRRARVALGHQARGGHLKQSEVSLLLDFQQSCVTPNLPEGPRESSRRLSLPGTQLQHPTHNTSCRINKGGFPPGVPGHLVWPEGGAPSSEMLIYSHPHPCTRQFKSRQVEAGRRKARLWGVAGAGAGVPAAGATGLCGRLGTSMARSGAKRLCA